MFCRLMLSGSRGTISFVEFTRKAQRIDGSGTDEQNLEVVHVRDGEHAGVYMKIK